MGHGLEKYEPFKGELSRRNTGSLVAFETGDAVPYGLYNAQEAACSHGPASCLRRLIVGVSPKAEDISVTSAEEAGDKHARLRPATRPTPRPPQVMSLEQCIEFMADENY